MQVRTVGNEAEMELAFAALQRLCAPGLGVVARLPAPQRDALEVSFGLTSGPAPDRPLVGLAVLNLFCELARKLPVLCIVDDAQWLDKASSQAIAFVARRVTNERIALELGARVAPDEMRGLPALRVEGLDRRDARALLSSALPERVDEVVLERVVAETRGNPLALLELPRGLTPAQLAGGFNVPVATPLAGRIKESFRRRLTRLPAESRLLLLVAAADPTGDPVLLWRAADLLALPDSAADAVEADGLLWLTTTVTFRHPLVRSAVYGAACPPRSGVPCTLHWRTPLTAPPIRIAGLGIVHRRRRVPTRMSPTNSSAPPNELTPAGVSPRPRPSWSALAELTTDAPGRARRALVAAEAKRQAGALDAALGLAAVAERGPLDGAQRAQLDVLRAQSPSPQTGGTRRPRSCSRRRECSSVSTRGAHGTPTSTH